MLNGDRSGYLMSIENDNFYNLKIILDIKKIFLNIKMEIKMF